MAELNQCHFVAKVGGDVFVFDEEDKNILSDAMTFTGFQQFHAGNQINGKKFATMWLNSASRRTYNALSFDPSGKVPQSCYNTWRGLAIEPKKGKCRKIYAHIRDIWCGGDHAQLKYVLKWMALLVQKPWLKPEVALVLRSKEGTGKTIIVQILLRSSASMASRLRRKIRSPDASTAIYSTRFLWSWKRHSSLVTPPRSLRPRRW